MNKRYWRTLVDASNASAIRLDEGGTCLLEIDHESQINSLSPSTYMNECVAMNWDDRRGTYLSKG